MTTKAHSDYGGSSASRWMTCPGSVALCNTVPALPTSAYAEEGTLAHAYAEALLTQTYGLGDVIFPEGVSDEMKKHVAVYVDAVAEEANAPGTILRIEDRFEINVTTAEKGEIFGRNDACVYNPTLKKLTVFDLKYGAGVSVDADDNAQLKFYAVGAAFANDWPLEIVEIVIVQPRAHDVAEKGAVRRWSWSPAELVEFFGEIEAAVGRAKHPGAPLAEGKHCRWCSAASICPLRTRNVAEMLGVSDLTSITPAILPKADSFDFERLGKTLDALDTLDAWSKQVRSYAEGLLHSGQSIPGWKLVEKQARRKWIDDDQAIAAYLNMTFGVPYEEVMPPKLATITEVERVLAAHISDKKALKAAKEDISLRYTIKESSGMTMARSTDRREAVNQASAFASAVL